MRKWNWSLIRGEEQGNRCYEQTHGHGQELIVPRPRSKQSTLKRNQCHWMHAKTCWNRGGRRRADSKTRDQSRVLHARCRYSWWSVTAVICNCKSLLIHHHHDHLNHERKQGNSHGIIIETKLSQTHRFSTKLQQQAAPNSGVITLQNWSPWPKFITNDRWRLWWNTLVDIKDAMDHWVQVSTFRWGHSIGPSIVWNDKVEKMDNLKWGPIRWCFTFVPPTPPSGSIGPDVSVDKSLLSLWWYAQWIQM